MATSWRTSEWSWDPKPGLTATSGRSRSPFSLAQFLKEFAGCCRTERQWSSLPSNRSDNDMYELEINTSDYQEVAQIPAISSEAIPPGDISEPFERWLDSLKADPYSPLAELVSAAEIQQLAQTPSPSETHSQFATPCEMSFKGTLHIDGYFTGNVRSAQGTLVL